jgi:hypothetical protein
MEFFSTSDDSVFGFINGERKNEIKLTVIAGCILLYLVSCTGLYFLYRSRKKPENILIGAAWLGILLSVPLVPPLDATRMRVYAATIAFVAILPTLGIYFITKLFPKLRMDLDDRDTNLGTWISMPMISTLSLIFLVCGAGLFLKSAATTAADVISCNAGEYPVEFQMKTGSYIHVVKDDSITQDWLPNLRELRYVIGVHGISIGYSNALSLVKAPFVLTSGINLINAQRVFLVVPDRVSGFSVGKLQMCAVKMSDSLLNSTDFYEVTRILK